MTLQILLRFSRLTNAKERQLLVTSRYKTLTSDFDSDDNSRIRIEIELSVVIQISCIFFVYYGYGKMASEEIIEANKKPQPVFKNRSFQQKFRPTSTTGKKRTWRSLKQVLAQERSLPWPATVKLYSSINAPPSFKPAKKYSDISGLPARYTDPQTKLYYATAEEFATVRSLPMDITAGYLALRGASSIVG